MTSVKDINNSITQNEYISSEFEISYYGTEEQYIELESDNTFYIEPNELPDGLVSITISDRHASELTSTDVNDILDFIRAKNVLIVEDTKYLDVGVEWDSYNNLGVDIDDLIDKLKSIKEEYPNVLKIVLEGSIDEEQGENLWTHITRYETLEEKTTRVLVEQDERLKTERELLKLKERVRQLECQLKM